MITLNDTATASPKGPLSLARQYVAATGNKDFGYTVGGSPGPTRVDRIDYANDTADAPARGNLASPSVYHGATGNQDFGYTAGGHSGSAVSTITRIDYANDSAQSVVKGPLSIARYGTE